MSKLILLTLPPSPHNTKVRLALKLKGLDFEAVEVDFEDRAEVVRRSGQPLTPVLLDGDRVVYDSFGILRYLDANWPETKLFRSDKDGQREIEAWERFGVIDVLGVISPVARQAFSGQIDDEAIQQAQAQMRELPSRIEEALQESSYLMGDQPNAADLTVVPFLRYAASDPSEFAEGTPMRSVAEQLEIDPSFPRTRAWIKRVMALDLTPAEVK